MENSLSIIIKTFERPASLKKLLASIRKLGLTYPVLIADDSKNNSGDAIKRSFPDLNITYIPVAFDSGLSEGRNVLLSQVKTPYFLLCDDDFVFDHRTDIKKALNSLIEHKLDILGGDFYNYVTISNVKRLVKIILNERVKLKRFLLNEFETSRYIGKFVVSGNNCELQISHLPPPTSPYPCDIVNNFFVANTDSVKRMNGWDSALKMGEHEDFFYRAKQNNLAVAYLAGFGTGHFPIIKSNYKKYRFRANNYKSMFVQKNNFKHYAEILKDTNVILFEVNNP